jgi:MoxR-like ATPase
MILHNQLTQKHSISSSLHVQGWQHLDAILLAALATESPTLLIGPHGTAKTLLVERIAHALGLEFRHYNASLINYDDLVGIPMPEEGQEQLRFITTPGAIWDAEFVFFDEISRCRPDLQNKLFPIIHERRVIGMNLSKLRYRWSAMNPPSPDNPDLDMSSSEYYLGSEPLDPALIDRFPFVIPVPNWRDLSRDDRRKLLAARSSVSENGTVTSFDKPLNELVSQCQSLLNQVEEEQSEVLIDYMIAVMDLLERAHLPQSPRRARMLTQSIIAVHAARLLLEGEDIDLAESAERALLYGLPQTATEVPPSPAAIVAIHRQAWEIASMLDDEVWRQILAETDPFKRILIADDLDLSDEDMANLITQALSFDASEARKISLATALFLRFRKYRHLTPAAWEPLVKLAGRVLLPRMASASFEQNTPDMEKWTAIKNWVLEARKGDALAYLLTNYVLGGFPELWRQHDWEESVKQFDEDLKFFGVEELS